MGPELNDTSPASVHWFTYLWVWAIAMTGSIIGQLNTAHEDKAPLKIMDFIANNLTAAFVGTILFYLFESFHANAFASAAAIGMAGNMSGVVYRRLKAWAVAALDKFLPEERRNEK